VIDGRHGIAASYTKWNNHEHWLEGVKHNPGVGWDGKHMEEQEIRTKIIICKKHSERKNLK